MGIVSNIAQKANTGMLLLIFHLSEMHINPFSSSSNYEDDLVKHNVKDM